MQRGWPTLRVSNRRARSPVRPSQGSSPRSLPGHEAGKAKGRLDGLVPLPAALYKEVEEICGKKDVWERLARRRPYSPKRCVKRLQDTLAVFRKQHPEIASFKGHNRRETAISKVETGVSRVGVSISFRCKPQTMPQHDLNLSERNIVHNVAGVLWQ
jgi:hypothetical protein